MTEIHPSPLDTKPRRQLSPAIEELERLYEHFENRKRRATKRAEQIKKEWWSFALVGFKMKKEKYIFHSDKILIQAVKEPPGHVELATALKDGRLLATASRYAQLPHYELLIHKDISHNVVFLLSEYIISLIRIKSRMDFLVPIAFNCSLSTICAYTDNSIDAVIIEDNPKTRIIDKKENIKSTDLNWVNKHTFKLYELMQQPNINLAIESYCTYNQQASIRMSIAALWSGIEAVFKIQGELTFRISLYTAALLGKSGKERKEIFNAMKKLYVFRSKVIHGNYLNDKELLDHCVQAKSILSKLLVLIIENGHAFTQDEIEGKLLRTSP